MTLSNAIATIKDHLNQQRYAQAIATCQHSLDHFSNTVDPNITDLYWLWGKALGYLSETEKAIAIYHQGLISNPHHAFIHGELGQLYHQQGRPALAISHYQKALQDHPYWADIHCRLGTLFFQLGRHPEAKQYYQQAIDCGGQLARAYLGIGLIYQQQGESAQAIAYCQQAIHHDPSHFSAYTTMGHLLMKKRAYHQAIDLWYQALEHCNNPVPIYEKLGQVYVAQEDIINALTAYETAHQLTTDSAIAPYRLGQLSIRYQQYTQANRYFQQAWDLGFKNAALSSAWSQSLLDQGHWAKAITLLGQAIHSQAEIVTAYCQQAATLSPDNAFSRVRIACAELLAILQTISPTQTEHSVDSVTIAASPPVAAIEHLGHVYGAIADLFYESQFFEKAISPLQKNLAINPNQPERYLQLSHCLAHQNRMEGAIAIYQTGAILHPHHFTHHPTTLESILATKHHASSELSAHCLLKGVYQKTSDWEQTYQSHKSYVYPLYQPIEWGNLPTPSTPSTPPINAISKSPSSHPIIFFPDASADKSTDPTAKITTKPTTTTQTTTEKICGGVTCSSCMDRLIQSFHPTQLAPNVYQCSPQNQSLIPPHFPFVVTIPNGVFWATPQTSDWIVCDEIAVITPDNYVLGDLSRFYPWYLPGCQFHSMEKHGVAQRKTLSTQRQLSGNVAVLSSLSGNVYYHWMMDVLPRIGILQNSTWSLNQIDWFVVNSLTHNFQTETLEAIGIPLERVIESDRSPHINAQNLIVPSFPGHLDWVSQGTIDFLRTTFLPDPSSEPFLTAHTLAAQKGISSPSPTQLAPPSFIYISRATARYRRVLNEAAVVELLQPFGFVTIALETLSVAQQVTLFANAQVIISPHGSSLTNLVFCQSGTRVLELFNQNYLRTDYWMISQMLDLQHYYQVCPDFSCYPLRKLMYQTALTEDIYVDLKTLHFAVSQLMKSTRLKLSGTGRSPQHISS